MRISGPHWRLVGSVGSLCILTFALLGAAGPLTGTFALQAARPQARGHLTVRPVVGEPLARMLDFWLTRDGSSTVVRRYDLDMTKYLHFVIVSDDFRTFLHVHPRFQGGRFRLIQHFPRSALYHIYADGEPEDIGQQVFRFDVPIGSPTPVKRRLGPSGLSSPAGPYAVTFGRATLSREHETTLTIHIRKHGHPARDLHPYLGALAHVVLLDAEDLTYVHGHPVPLDAPSAARAPDTAGMSGAHTMTMAMHPLAARAVTTPDMLVHVSVHEPGRYELWLQFLGGGSLRVARLLLTAT